METSDIQFYQVTKDLILTCENNPVTFSEKIKNRVDEIWKELKKKKEVFDGTFFSVRSITQSHICGQFFPYRYLVAFFEDTALQKEFALLPMGISCITMWQDRVLLGKRSPKVYSYSGLYEFVPSGTIDERCKVDSIVDYKKQIAREFEEETTIDPSVITSIVPIGVFQKKSEPFCDLCFVIELDPLQDLSFIRQSEEYTELMWVKKENVRDFLTEHSKTLVPKQDVFWESVNQRIDHP